MTESDINIILPDKIANRDWVAERAKCDVRNAFDVLRERITHDVEQFNALKENREGNVKIPLEQHSGYISIMDTTSYRPATDRSYVIFNRVQDHIEIDTGAKEKCIVKPVWDLDTRTMKFQVENDGRLLTASQLSEQFLLPVLFPGLTNRHI